jgi:phytoene dehydrogenase-like protein
MDFPKPTDVVKTDILIVGGGIAGLSAARYLKKFTNNFMLTELEENTGGNAIGGSNQVSAFPWGAHYLPLPGNKDPELINFLADINVITGYADGLPVFNEYYLCHDPKERLFINHYWQDSIIPHEGIPKQDREEIQRFLEMMHEYKQLKGGDGREAFAIPLDESSQDKKILALDAITAQQFLQQHNFRSEYLKWYVSYCCADDYGSSLEETSAWAMIHYFASRKGNAANATSDAVLTWPEGNYWLVNQLQRSVQDHIVSNTVIFSVNVVDDHVEAIGFDAINNISKKIIAKRIILATPQFVNHQLLKNISRSIDYSTFQYSSWMVANLTVNSYLNEHRGEQLCWDNVIYGSGALGYVNAGHQQVGLHGNKKVITYYKPLWGDGSATARRVAQGKKFTDWRTDVLRDLKIPHAGIEREIEEMNIWLWGHGMVKPTRGFTWGENRMKANSSIAGKIFFAHSDLSGISIFEEAFYKGYQSAKSVLAYAT